MPAKTAEMRFWYSLVEDLKSSLGPPRESGLLPQSCRRSRAVSSNVTWDELKE